MTSGMSAKVQLGFERVKSAISRMTVPVTMLALPTSTLRNGIISAGNTVFSMTARFDDSERVPFDRDCANARKGTMPQNT